MGYKRIELEKDLDEAEYRKYFGRHQAEYIRKRLRILKMYSEGLDYETIAAKYSVHHQTVRQYVLLYNAGGLARLCEKIKRPNKTMLDAAQAAAFKEVLLTKSPSEVSLDGNIWTGKLMCAYLEKTYGVVYKSGIYDLLERLNLSHQKAHSDYENADPAAQREFFEDFKEQLSASNSDEGKTAVMVFDEFSVCEKPSSYYSWAEKNTRPKVVTNEKKEDAATDF